MCTHAGRSSILAIDLSTLHTLSKLRLCHRTETSLALAHALATPSQLSTKVPRLLSLSNCTGHTLFTSQSKPRFLALLPEGPLSEAGGGEDLIISVAKERDKVLLALLDLAQRLVVSLAQPFDHGCDSACGVGAWGAWWGDRYGP